MAKETYRPDIQAAVDRMDTKFGGGRELKKLHEHLADGETVRQLTTGLYGKGNGLLTMTDRRLLFLFEGVFGKMSEDFPFTKISSIQWSTGMLLGTIVVHASGVKSEITQVSKVTGKQIVDAVREQISPGATPSPEPAAAPAGASAIDELTKLAALHQAGALTDDEFAAAKQRVLG